MTSHLGERISPLVDGQLDHDDRDRAFAHLARCAQCQSEVAEYRRLKARLAALSAPQLPPRLAENLLKLAAAHEFPVAAPPRRLGHSRRIRMAGSDARPASVPVPAAPSVVGTSVTSSAGPASLAGPASSSTALVSSPGLGQPAPVPGTGTLVVVEERAVLTLEKHSVGGGPAGRATVSGLAPAVVGRRRSSRPAILASFPGRLTSAGPAAPDRGQMKRPQAKRRPPSTPAVSRRQHRRMRRALVGSAAFMLLAVTSSALAEGRGTPRHPGPTMVPAVASVGQPVGRKTGDHLTPVPMVAPVSLLGRP